MMAVCSPAWVPDALISRDLDLSATDDSETPDIRLLESLIGVPRLTSSRGRA